MNFQCLFDILPYQQATYSNNIALARKDGLQWITFSTSDCLEQVQKVSAGALQLGLKRGEKIAILASQGSPEWHFIDFGMQQIGVIVLPIHAALSEKELLQVLKNTGIKYCFVQNRELHDKIQNIQSNVLSLKKIYTLVESSDLPYWKDILTIPTAHHLQQIQALRAVIHEDDLATIVFTPGITTTPKGVMLSHKNIVSGVKSLLSLTDINCDKVAMSIIPISYIFERVVTFTYMAAGVSIYYTNESKKLLSDLHEVRPHYISSTPAMLKRIYGAVLKRSYSLPTTKYRLFQWSLKVGMQYPDQKISLLYWFKLQLATLLTFNRWRVIAGKQLDTIIVGTDHLPAHLARLFTAAGFNIKEIYGLTETAAMLTINQFESGSYRFGTSGKPLPSVELKIDNEALGEVLVKGDNVMLGYFNGYHSSTSEGWFKTGDFGMVDEDGFLRVIDKQANYFEYKDGISISLRQLEEKLLTSPYIQQCLIVGKQRPYLTALIIPNFDLLSRWCEQNEVAFERKPSLVIQPKVERLFQKIIEEVNESLQAQERIDAHYLLFEAWTVENGLITSIGKIKRQAIQAKFQREIESLYA